MMRPYETLGPRERQTLALLGEGLKNREIAARMGVTHHTIKKYISCIFDKLGVDNRVEAGVWFANHRGL